MRHNLILKLPWPGWKSDIKSTFILRSGSPQSAFKWPAGWTQSELIFLVEESHDWLMRIMIIATLNIVYLIYDVQIDESKLSDDNYVFEKITNIFVQTESAGCLCLLLCFCSYSQVKLNSETYHDWWLMKRFRRLNECQ